MTTEQQEEAGPVTVQIGVCSVCHALFLISGDRETSPCHGSDTLAVLATLTIGPDGEVDGSWGSYVPRPLITREEAISMFKAMGFSREEAEKRLPPEEPAPAPAPPAEPTAEVPPEAVLPEEAQGLELVLEEIGQYLADSDWSGDSIAARLEDMGAEPEAAATAVGRLSAVRELLEQLSAARERAPVAPAPSEAENSPENT